MVCKTSLPPLFHFLFSSSSLFFLSLYFFLSNCIFISHVAISKLDIGYNTKNLQRPTRKVKVESQFANARFKGRHILDTHRPAYGTQSLLSISFSSLPHRSHHRHPSPLLPATSNKTHLPSFHPLPTNTRAYLCSKK